jgi:hypothetical protein
LAIRSYERARARWEKLVQAHPHMAEYQNHLKKVTAEMEKMNAETK